jgi:NAD(P)-dependent dehydrogenase (short-subunit alcohol dehydrogenase family)
MAAGGVNAASGAQLQGKVAIVTGGAGGIGSATCLALGREGAAVVVADLDASGAERVARQVTERGGRAIAFPVDLTQESAVVALVGETVRSFGRLDVLHNNAALTAREVLSRDTTVTEVDLEVWDQVFAGNLRSQVLTCKHAIPAMLARGGGSIINMSSGAAAIGDSTRIAYGVSKAGVEALTRYIAASHGRDGIRVNSIVPGLILTGSVREQIPEAMLEHLSRSTSTPALGVPEDIAELVVFLAGDGSRYLTGQRLPVDGGSSTRAGHVGMG